MSNAPGDPYAKDRLVVDLKPFGVPGALTAGRVNFRKAQAPLEPHVHPGAVEICFLERGAQTYTTRDREYRLRSGDVFVSFPDEVHGTGGSPEEKSILYYLILALPRPGRGFLGQPDRDGRRLCDALRTLPRRHFAGEARLKAPLDTIIRDLSPDHPFAPMRLRACLTAFLLRILELAERPQSWEISPAIRTVMDAIRASPGDDFSLSDLAAQAGLSVSHFKARFRRETGIPPREFILREKIALARNHLETGGQSVTDTAFALGFSSSQYFATVFKRYTGLTPREVAGARGRAASRTAGSGVPALPG